MLNLLEVLELGIKADYFFSKCMKYHISWSGGYGSVPENFQISDVDQDPLSAKCGNIKFRYFLIYVKASIFVCRNIEYHMHSCSGHGPVVIDIRQRFTFTASNSAPIVHFGRCPGDPPWHNRHNRTDIAESGSMPAQFWLTMAQFYREVAIMKQDHVIGPKSVRWSPLCPLRHCLFRERLQNWAFWAELNKANLKGCSLFSDTEPWPIH